MSELEDVHRQIELDNSDGDLIGELLDYDIIVRVNDDGTKYEGFHLYNYKLEKYYGWVSFSDGSFHPQEGGSDE